MGCRGNTDPGTFAAQGRMQRTASASQLIEDPDCQSYKKQLMKESGQRCQNLQETKKEWKNRKWSVIIAQRYKGAKTVMSQVSFEGENYLEKN